MGFIFKMFISSHVNAAVIDRNTYTADDASRVMSLVLGE